MANFYWVGGSNDWDILASVNKSSGTVYKWASSAPTDLLALWSTSSTQLTTSTSTTLTAETQIVDRLGNLVGYIATTGTNTTTFTLTRNPIVAPESAAGPTNAVICATSASLLSSTLLSTITFSDSVFFTSSALQTINLYVNRSFTNLTVSGSQTTFNNILILTSVLNIYGDINLHSNTIISAPLSSITLIGGGTKSISTNNASITLYQLNFSSEYGTWVLTSNFQLVGTLNHTRGTFNTAGYDVDVTHFISTTTDTTSTRTLSFGSSTIKAKLFNIYDKTSTSTNLDAPLLTLNAGTSNIIIDCEGMGTLIDNTFVSLSNNSFSNPYYFFNTSIGKGAPRVYVVLLGGKTYYNVRINMPPETSTIADQSLAGQVYNGIESVGYATSTIPSDGDIYPNVTIFEDNTFNTLDIYASSSTSSVSSICFYDGVQTIGTLNVYNTTPRKRIYFIGRGTFTTTPRGSAKTLLTIRGQLSVGTLNCPSTDWNNIEVLGAAAGTFIDGGGDFGNNSGITFPYSKKLYFTKPPGVTVPTNGTVNITDNVWALTSGGAPQTHLFPFVQDTMVFDNNTVLGTTNPTISWNAKYCYGDVDGSTRTNSIIMDFNSTFNFFLNKIFSLGSGVATKLNPSSLTGVTDCKVNLIFQSIFTDTMDYTITTANPGGSSTKSPITFSVINPMYGRLIFNSVSAKLTNNLYAYIINARGLDFNNVKISGADSSYSLYFNGCSYSAKSPNVKINRDMSEPAGILNFSDGSDLYCIPGVSFRSNQPTISGYGRITCSGNSFSTPNTAAMTAFGSPSLDFSNIKLNIPLAYNTFNFNVMSGITFNEVTATAPLATITSALDGSTYPIINAYNWNISGLGTTSYLSLNNLRLRNVGTNPTIVFNRVSVTGTTVSSSIIGNTWYAKNSIDSTGGTSGFLFTTPPVDVKQTAFLQLLI